MLALITATRNSMVTLPRSLASIDFDFGRVKHVFVDGASTDGTVDYLKKFASGVRNAVVQSQVGTGLYEALNQGIELAVTDPEVTHIGMFHSDDRLIPGNYSDYLSCVESRYADIYYSDIDFHNPTNDIVRIWRSGKYSRFKLKTGWMPPHTSMIVAKSVYRNFGVYNPAYGTAADYEWIVRILSAKPESIYYFPKRTISMLIGGASSVNIKARLRANQMDGKVWAGRSRFQSAIIRVCKPIRKINQFMRVRSD